ncbi:spatacsin carboxy-terminus protein isoform X3 [Carex rostrata]
MRQMQLALHYSKFDEIEQSLSKLVDVDLAEEGVLRLLFASVYPIFVRVASENEIVFATRLISLAASFATKMIRKYALLDQNMNDSYSGRLCEMAYFLEVIRDLQSRVSAKCKKLVDKEVDDTNSRDPGTETLPDASNDDEFYSSNNNLALTLAEPSTELVEQAGIRQLFIPENVKDMIARWELSNLDLKSVVKDALKSGRLPLAVHQLRLLHQKEDDTAVSSSDEKSHNAFNEVREIGISIAYDLFVQGETDLAVATLEKLGEDIELVLRQLLFGTVRRSLRVRIIDQMKRRGFLRLDETRILERILLIERLYPRSSFWVTYQRSQRDLSEHTSLALYVNDSPIFCGEVDGAILGVWADISTYTELPEPFESTTPGGYWACAAAWSDAWDQRTIDRVVLDQHYQMEIQVPWESQFEYHVAHNNLQEILDLLDTIPIHLQSEGILMVNLRNISATQNQGLYICAGEEIEPSYIDVPGVIILRHPYFKNGTLWLRTLIEKELAKRNIFLRDHWEDTGEIVTVLARAGLMFNISEASDMNNASDEKSLQIQEVEDPPDTKLSDEGFHKLVIHFCVQNELPYLLDYYLDHHNLVGDHNSLHVLLDAAGDCQWAKWLLFSRLRGYEYEASLSNACWKLSRNLGSGGSGGNFLEIEEKINIIDDLIAEGVGEIAALATLMYATFPIENCLSLETLDRPSLREYPTMLKSLISACSDRDYSRPTDANKVLGNRVLSEYFNWRYGVFYSTGGDASLLQILQAAFPKPVRRLVQLFVQGPFSLQVMEFEKETLNMSDEFLVRCLRHSILKIAGDNKTDPIVLEASVQKSIEKELFSAEEKGFKVEQDLNRGRVLAVFSSLIGKRALELRSTDQRLDQSVKPNVVFDTQKFLRPLNQSERSVLQWVVPLAIRSFDDSSVVTSCGFFFELCGISFEMLRLDINALRRISSKYGRADKTLALNLAKELAEEYIKYDYLEINSQNQKMPPSKTLVNILHYLEEASLPVIEEEDNCGTWLKTGTGDASHLRSKQSEASRYWSLVIDFCQVHHLPISTKYLALLASNNDWVGFLMEAQLGGFSADVVSQVATKELKDARLRAHVLTVLRSMKSAPKKSDDEGYLSANEESNTPAELFMVVTQCEKQKFPGEALLRKARLMRWPFLAIVASCFNDISTLSCAAFWLEITGSRLSLIKADKIILEIAKNVGLAVEHTNKLPPEEYNVRTTFDRQNAKRQRISEPAPQDSCLTSTSDNANVQSSILMIVSQEATVSDERKKTEEALGLLAEMVVLFCEKQMFLPLLRAFELFLPLCPLLSLIRSLQAFSQMRLAEASAHLAAFSARTKEEQSHTQPALLHDELLNQSPWLSSTAVNAADAVLSTCPTLYEKRSLLQLLASADFGDDGSLAAYFKRLYWKINLAESDLKTDWFDKLDDGALLTELEKRGRWEEARSWARQLGASNASWKSAVHHVTESQAEAMVSEWKEFLWDFPQERAALWGHCQALFVRYSFPPLQAGSFFLKHAEAIEKEIPARELHEMLLLSLQWLSGTITQIPPVYPLHLLREIETRVWLLAVESETQSNPENEPTSPSSVQNLSVKTSLSFIEQTAKVVSKMDSHINATHTQVSERSSGIFRENNNTLSSASAGSRTKRKGKPYHPLRHTINENFETSDEINSSEGTNLGVAISGWEERVGQVEMERAVLSLLEFGQITAAKQLQHKLSPTQVPEELNLIDSVLKLAKFASSNGGGEISLSVLDEAVRSVLRSLDLPIEQNRVDPSQALDALSRKCGEGRGRGLCLRVIAVVRAAMVLGLTFAEAFGKQPLELLQLLSLKAQVSIEEATLLVETYSPPPPSIALILAESFLKGLLAAHRGGYLENQKEEGPEPLLWRSSDFLKWAKLCPSESEIGHALMRVVMTGQVPRACEVEILILAHHFYMSSACLDGVDVLVTFVANRVESYVLEDDFSSLARLVTGVANFRSFSFILDILIESGQLELLLEKYSAAAETATGSVAAVRGIRMTVLTSLKRYNPHDLDAFAMVYNHFDMKHDAAKLLESRSTNRIHHWLSLKDRDRRERSGELLDSMCHLIEAGETLSTIDAGQRTHRACARASLLTLQIRIPDITWVQLSETNARRILVEQSRFQEALVVAEAYGLNQPMEWAPVFWTLMLKPDLLEQFVADFVAVLPLQPSMLHELARFYRSEVSARGDQKHFSVWLSPGGLPAEWVKHLDRSFRSVLKRTRDLRVKMQLAVYATGFGDVVEACLKALDKVPDNAGPLVLRRGHGGAYLPLM